MKDHQYCVSGEIIFILSIFLKKIIITGHPKSDYQMTKLNKKSINQSHCKGNQSIGFFVMGSVAITVSCIVLKNSSTYVEILAV